jgi:hypothetical protein
MAGRWADASSRTFLCGVYGGDELALWYSWGPRTIGGVVFHIIYLFFGVGLFLLFVLEAGKTMAQSYEEFMRKMAERKAAKQARKQPAA